VPAGKEVLVDAQHRRAARCMPSRELVLQPALEVALHCGCANTFPPG